MKTEIPYLNERAPTDLGIVREDWESRRKFHNSGADNAADACLRLWIHRGRPEKKDNIYVDLLMLAER